MKQPSKMPGRPNSRGRLSLNLVTEPERSTKIRGATPREKTGKGFSPPEKKKKRRKKRRKAGKQESGRRFVCVDFLEGQVRSGVGVV